MSDQELRDKTGRLLGKIRIRPDGRLELRDRIGNLRGTYNPKDNKTRDKIGNLVGSDNLLTALLDD